MRSEQDTAPMGQASASPEARRYRLFFGLVLAGWALVAAANIALAPESVRWTNVILTLVGGWLVTLAVNRPHGRRAIVAAALLYALGLVVPIYAAAGFGAAIIFPLLGSLLLVPSQPRRVLAGAFALGWAVSVAGMTISFVVGPMGRLGSLAYPPATVATGALLAALAYVTVWWVAASWRLALEDARESAERAEAGEETLRASERRYRMLIEHASDAIFITDPEGRVLEVSDSASELLGYTREELLGLAIEDLVPPAGNPAQAERIAAIRQGHPSLSERLARRKDGSLVAIEVSAGQLPDGRFHAILRDLSARRAAEADRDRLATVVDETDDSVVVTDPDATIVHVNPAFERVTGYSRAEAIGQNPRILQSGRQTPAFYAEMWAKLATGQPWRGELHNRRKDGTVFIEDATITPVHDAAGTLVSYVAVKRDVTDRTAAEEALRRSEAELAEAQRIAHVGSWTWDPHADVMEWTEELFHIFGLPPTGPAPSFAEQQAIYTTETRQDLLDAVARAVETGEPYEVHVELRRPDGQVRYVAARGEVVRGSDGTVSRHRGTVADVTERRDARALLDQARRVEMIGRLAGGVAHDFNNVLAAIEGYAELLDDSLDADDPRHADVEGILEAGSRAAALTRQLLAFGRRQSLQQSVVDVNDVIAGIAAMLRTLMSGGVDLVLDIGQTVGHVLVDRRQLEQVIVNLVINARDANHGRGQVTIKTADVRLRQGDTRLRPGARAGAYVQLSVVDTGTGIDADTLPHIFEPFFTTKETGHGTGLGLASVDGIVAQSGGFIRVESTVGSGSAFSVFLPRTLEDAPASSTSAVRHAAARGHETVLLVDDDAGVRAVTSRILRDLGYAVVEAGDGEAALATAEAGPMTFDILLTDVVMPGIGGHELARRIAELRPGLPILFVSGYADQVAEGRDLPPGASLIAKPFDRDTLATRLRVLLD